jgi:hypothetical protein
LRWKESKMKLQIRRFAAIGHRNVALSRRGCGLGYVSGG